MLSENLYSKLQVTELIILKIKMYSYVNEGRFFITLFYVSKM